MPASSLQAYSAQVAKAFGLNDQGELVSGRWCLDSPHGSVCLSAYEGDALFLDWLGPWLEDAKGVTNRLSLSQLLPATSGHYYTSINGQTVILQGHSAGPPCDVHNSFELHSVSAGVAWVHQLSQGNASGPLSDWGKELQLVQSEAQHLRRPRLPRRVQSVWELLIEIWRLCLDQAAARWTLAGLKGEHSLLLGLQQFQDFVYVADRHLVHYNAVERCCVGLPAIELARLLRVSEYSLQTAEAMLYSYQRVRSLTDAEKQQLLACLWFPWEVPAQELTAPGLTIMTINRLRRVLEQKVAWVTELGEQLFPDLDEDMWSQADLEGYADDQVEQLSNQQKSDRQRLGHGEKVLDQDGEKLSIQKEVLSLPEKKAAQQKLDAPTEQVEQVNVTESVLNQPEAVAEGAPSIKLQSVPEKKVLVWRPFPRPLGAPPEEHKAEMEPEQKSEMVVDQDTEETETLELDERVAEEVAAPTEDDAKEEDLEP